MNATANNPAPIDQYTERGRRCFATETQRNGARMVRVGVNSDVGAYYADPSGRLWYYSGSCWVSCLASSLDSLRSLAASGRIRCTLD